MLKYVPFILFGLLMITALVVAAGETLGGSLAMVHGNLHAMLTGDDRPIPDAAVERATLSVGPVAGPAPTLVPAPVISPSLAITLPHGSEVLTLPTSAPCASFQFQGTLSIQRDSISALGRLSSGRFNLISSTFPYGKSDPLTSWKLLIFESLPLDTELTQDGPLTTLPVNKAVNLLITDPFTQIPLLSARWQVNEIDIWGKNAGINARLEPNLSDIRVNNAINSGTLSALSAATTGILTVKIRHTEDIAAEIRAGHPIFAFMSGTVHMEQCLK